MFWSYLESLFTDLSFAPKIVALPQLGTGSHPFEFFARKWGFFNFGAIITGSVFVIFRNRRLFHNIENWSFQYFYKRVTNFGSWIPSPDNLGSRFLIFFWQNFYFFGNIFSKFCQKKIKNLKIGSQGFQETGHSFKNSKPVCITIKTLGVFTFVKKIVDF